MTEPFSFVAEIPAIRTSETYLRYMAFVQAFTEFQADAAAINEKNGFSADDLLFDELEQLLLTDAPTNVYAKFQPIFASFRNARAGLKLALAMGELGETLEAVRKNLGPDSHIPEFTCEEAEVADAVIRLMNYATDRKLRLADAIFAKNEFNRNRADHSADARASEHGKRF